MLHRDRRRPVHAGAPALPAALHGLVPGGRHVAGGELRRASGLSRRSLVGWLVAVVLVSLNMRPAIASVPPIVDEIRGAYGLSAAAAGALTALPVVCMGLFAPAAAWVAGRWGTGRAIGGALVLLVVATAVRPLGGSALLFVGTVAVGIGVAVGGALLPALVRARFPDRVGPMTGVYTTALIGGALVAAGATEPLRGVLPATWRGALAFWALPAFARPGGLAVVATGLDRRVDRHVVVVAVAQPRRLVRDRLHGRAVAAVLRGAGVAVRPVHRARVDAAGGRRAAGAVQRGAAGDRARPARARPARPAPGRGGARCRRRWPAWC